MTNVIGICYVLQDLEYGAEPIIYLDRPVEYEPRFYKLCMFHTVFEAKAFIQNGIGGGVEITIERPSRHAPSLKAVK
jgi:hypothetical protein